MQNRKRLITLLLAGALAMSAVGCSSSSDSEPKVSDKTSKSDEKKAKEKPEAKDDFYDHVNFDELKDLEIPYGEEYSSPFGGMEAEEQLKAIIKRIGESNENFAPGSNEQLVHDAYQQFLSYKEEASTEKIIMGNCERILAAKNIEELFELWGELVREYGASSIFNISIERDYIDGSRYSLYLSPTSSFLDASIKKIKEERYNDKGELVGSDY